MNRMVSVISETRTPGTEDLFRRLLMSYEPDQGLSATPLDPNFLAEAINEKYFHGPVSEETQRRISEAIVEKRFGKPMSPEVALAIAKNLGVFTDPLAQRNIARAIWRCRKTK